MIDHSSELHKNFLQFQHQRQYHILQRPHSCQTPGPIFLLLAIKSVAANADQREAIRNTWGRQGLWGGRVVRRVFLLGQSIGQGRDQAEAQVAEETARYGDILEWGFHDSFFNVTLKELLFWRWFEEECATGVHYVLKGDDDVFVNTDRVLAFLALQAGPSERLYVGQAIVNTYPVRIWWNKYYIPLSMYSGKPYPPYLGGGGYLLSRESILLLHRASQNIPLFPIDDAYVGMCAKEAKIVAQNHPGFMSIEFSSSLHPCSYWGLMVLHKLTANNLHLLWSFFKQQGQSCNAHPSVHPKMLMGESSG
ncbi:B3GN3 acetylglucosaminyltransferase, partial [Amia calva]|nr:B3GN3 acetylglucosaminyltransferase [Amia calva]